MSRKNQIFIIFLTVFFGAFGSNARAATILDAKIDSTGQHLLVKLSYGASTDDSDKDHFWIDARACSATTQPIVECRLKVIDRYKNYRYGAEAEHSHSFSLRDYGLNQPSFSQVTVTVVADDQSSIAVKLPEFGRNSSYGHSRFHLIETQRPGANEGYFGFSNLVKHNLFNNFLFGISSQFGEGKPTDYVVAHQIELNQIAWKAKIESGNTLSFLSPSPTDPFLVMGGRFKRDNSLKSNLQLIDAKSGNLIRQFGGVESMDLTSSYWVKNRVLISHASVTEREVGSDVIIDRNILRGVISWHDIQTGELLRTIDSPLLEARAIEQSSDERQVVFAGFEGAAIIDVLTGKKLFMVHMSDLFGPEYARCNNFGCGSTRSGFSVIDVSADRRLIALARVDSPLYIIDTQTQKVVHRIEVKTPDGVMLKPRVAKIDALNRLIYVFAAEKYREPSLGHVLVFGLADGDLKHWYQGAEVLGVSGGNDDSTIFSPDFKYLFSADSADGVADSRMMRNASYRIYGLE